MGDAKKPGARRFERLWVEVAVARLAPALLQGVFIIIALVLVGIVTFEFFDEFYPGDIGGAMGEFPLVFLIPGTIACSIILSIPTLVARRGVRTWLLTAAAIAAAGVVGTVGCWLSGADEDKWFLMMFGASAGAAGLVEGIYEGSIATAYCGLIGGTVAGVAGPLVCHLFLEESYTDLAPLLFFVAPPVGNVGVSLSVAAGRWIRDIPKRQQPAAGAPSPDYEDGPEL